jgi:hypothetical protein
VLLPRRLDPIISIASSAELEGGKLGETILESLEAPTAIASTKHLRGSGWSILMPVDDDARFPVRDDVSLTVWTYVHHASLGFEPKPAMPSPPAPLRRLVADIAAIPYHLETWSSYAARSAKKCSVSDIQALAAGMAYRPTGTGTGERGLWESWFREQVAAALVIGHLGDEPWRTSARRAALEDLLDGIADWSCSAAAIALLDVASRDESARRLVIEKLMRATRSVMATGRYYHVSVPAALALLDIPGIEPIERAVAEQLLDQPERVATDFDAPPVDDAPLE